MSHSLYIKDIRSWLAFLLFYVCANTALAADNANETAYQVQPGDVLQVSVWRETDLQGEVLVRSDGGISFPLAGDMQVAGMSPAQISAAISERINKFIPDPVVTVTVKAVAGNRIYVVGKVNRPGEFPFSRPIDVMQAIALASGTTAFASVADIRILRRENGKLTTLRFDYTDVARGKALDSNIMLKSGDTIVVP